MTKPASAEVTQLLLAWGEGDQDALRQLMPLVHHELHRLAHLYMVGERSGHTLGTSALVNEAYLKLVDIYRVEWKNRAHFFAISATMMRRILVDYARRRQYQKRGGGVRHITLNEELVGGSGPSPDVVAIDDALNTLAAIDPRKVRIVELRFFVGLSVEETAEALNVSQDTVFRDWRLARAWLKRELEQQKDAGD